VIVTTPSPDSVAGTQKAGENCETGGSQASGARVPQTIQQSIDLNSLIGLPESDNLEQCNAGSASDNLPAASEKVESAVADSLPALRSELILEAVHFDKNGQPKWTLQDPLKSKYYKLGWLEFELLSRWDCNDIDSLVVLINSETTLYVTRSHVASLITMLINNELICSASDHDLQQLRAKTQASDESAMKTVFSFTMFYRKPLVNPDQFLTKANGLFEPLYRSKRLLLFVWAVLAAIALNGIAFHWFEFRDTFKTYMTFEGFALFAAVLVFTNILHEIGHGLVAKHYQCRVTEMGLALIFMLPVCYCDTSDTWRLTDRRKRLLVSAGGILMELAIATVACLFWLMLPDGISRTLAFFLAVTSLVTTLFINLNPFMKFDGYYLLADILGVDNLQTRSFVNFRWQLRQWFTGCLEEKPHRVPESSHTMLNVYALSTWLYRLVLYFTICWMVYQFWFKALGLLLMTGVFFTMIVTPVAKEVMVYGDVIKKTGITLKSIVFFGTLFLMVALLCLPLPRKVSAPAMLGSGYASKIFATSAAQVSVVHVKPGDKLSAGQSIVTLKDPELEFQKLTLTQNLATLKRRKLTETQWLAKDVGAQISNYDIEVVESALAEIQEQIDSLVLVAKADSSVTRLPSWLKKDIWVNTNDVLAELASSEAFEVRAYVPAAKRTLLDNGSAKFYSNAGTDSIDLKGESISHSNIDVLTDHSLAVINGGEIAVSQTADGELEPAQGWVSAVLKPAEKNLEISSERSGYVMFSAQSKSLISSVFDRVYGVVIRESGF